MPNDNHKQIIKEALSSFPIFATHLWHFLRLPSPTPVQYQLADYLQNGPNRRIIMAYRGCGKSFLTAGYVLWRLRKNPDTKVLVISAAQDRADAFSVFCHDLLRNLFMVKDLFPSDTQRFSKVAFDVFGSKPDQSPSVRSSGIFGQITGSRADLIVADDVETPQSCETQLIRDKLRESIKEFDSVIKPGGEIVFLGTPHTQDSIYAKLELAGYSPRIWPALYPTAKKLKDYYGDRLAPRVRKDFEEVAPKNMIPLISTNPYHSFALVANAFYPMKDITNAGVHPRAHVESNVKYHDTVQISPGAIVSSNVVIGSNCFVGANTVILSGVNIGANTIIGSNCTIAYSIIGSNVKIHNGVQIGQDGFGFAQNENMNLKMPQLGRVIIKDNVEIGSNCTIDRGTGPDTIIGDGTKLDNLVQIGHNAIIGKNCIFVAQSGVSGSTQVGNNVIIGGQVGIAGHLKIGNNVKIAAKSGVMKNIEDGATVGGVPSVEIKDWHRQTIILKKLISKKKNGK